MARHRAVAAVAVLGQARVLLLAVTARAVRSVYSRFKDL